VSLKSGSGVTQGHRKWHHLIACIWFPITILPCYRVVVSVSTSRSRDVFFKCLGLVLVSGHNVSFTSGHLNKFFCFFHLMSFATLQPLALQLFSAPCRSAASERVFSQSGLIMRPTRSRLTPSRLAMLVFLKCNKRQPCKWMTDLVGYRLAWLSEKWKSSHSQGRLFHRGVLRK